MHNTVAMEHHTKLSYFEKWSSSFPVSLSFLESLHLNVHILLLWESTVVTRGPGEAFASYEDEGT